MESLNERIKNLEEEILELKSKLEDLSENTEEKYKTPVSIVGGGRNRGIIAPVDIKAGLGQMSGGSIIWNSSELDNPPIDEEPPVPNNSTGKGYNKHSHSRFSGGALINGVIEIVDLDLTYVSNVHSQQFWQTVPKIKKQENSKGEQVNKIGLLDLVFNPDTQSWGCPAYEIDIKKCYFVERVTEITETNPTLGAIKKDSKGQEMKSPLYNEDVTKTSIIWDENAQCFRLLAVYADSGE